MARAPDRFYIDPGDRELYKKLQEENLFKGLTNKEQFLLALGVGFRNRAPEPLERREGFFLAKDLKVEDEALLYALALSLSGPEALGSLAEVYRLAEEHAHGGLALLVSELEGTALGSFEKKLELEVHEMLEDLGSELDATGARPSR